MHPQLSAGSTPDSRLRWHQGVTRYQWWVYTVGAMAWLFDCMDTQFFTMVRSPALSQLLGRPENHPVVTDYATYATAHVLLPVMGFFNLSIMGGFVVYFPEIFPTRLRSTGTAFGYNVARLSAAVVMLLSNHVRDALAALHVEHPFRVGAVAVSAIYVLGLFALIRAPETNGWPLPEE